MRTLKKKLGVLLFGLLGCVNMSYAALIDLGNGLVHDTTLNIAWMKDITLVKTSCDANNALWQAFNPTPWILPIAFGPPNPNALPVGERSGRSLQQICNEFGKLNWFEAKVWLDILNSQNYLGYNDWREPSTTQPDLTCESVLALGGNGGYNCRGSELGHLFNVSLGNPNNGGTGTGLDGSAGTVGTSCADIGTTTPYCFQNKGPFDMLDVPIDITFGSATEYAFDTNQAWVYVPTFGFQSLSEKVAIDYSDLNSYIWPVRAMPPPPQAVSTLSVWGLGIMSLLLAFVARRKVW